MGIREAFNLAKSVEKKDCITDLVTETDQKVESHIIKTIKDTYPDHEFIGEETVAASNNAKLVLTEKPTWVVDPVDGTTNFVHQFPHTCVCIGFLANKITEFGVVYNPIRQEMFAGRLNFGATLTKIGTKNETAMDGDNASNTTETTEILKINKEIVPDSILGTLIITEFGSSNDPKKIDFVFDNMQKIYAEKCHGIRSMGSAALNICFVAAGRADAYYEAGMHIWDICAAGIVLREAGGTTIGLNGEDLDLFGRKIIAANNGSLAAHIARVTSDIDLIGD